MKRSFMSMVAVLPLLVTITVSPVWSGGRAARPLHWILQSSPTTSDLADISCASASECFAVGANATILKTENGGKVWQLVRPPYTLAHPAASFVSVRCPAPGVCSVLTVPNVVLHTTDGGRTWQKHVIALPPLLSRLGRLACPTRPICFATASPSGSAGTWSDHSAAVFKTGDGNRTWRRLPIPSSTPCDGDCTTTGYDLQWISCQSGQSCYAGGSRFIDSHTGYASALIHTENSGRTWQNLVACRTPPGPCLTFAPTVATCPTVTICTGVYYAPGSVNPGPSLHRSTNGGRTWTGKSISTLLTSIACTGKLFCALAGSHGRLAITIGMTLSPQPSPTTRDLTAIACPRVNACYAVGVGGTILALKNG